MAYKYMYNNMYITIKLDLEILFFEEISCNLTLFDVYDVLDYGLFYVQC